jgi:hypothetical protein
MKTRINSTNRLKCVAISLPLPIRRLQPDDLPRFAAMHNEAVPNRIAIVDNRCFALYSVRGE